MHYSFTVPKGDDYYAIMLQLMDHEPNGSGLPTFQIAIRKGMLCYRHTEILANGTRGYMKYEDIMPFEWDTKYAFTLSGILSNADGYLMLTTRVNGIDHHTPVEVPTVTASPTDEGVQVQFGIYGKETMHMECLVHYLVYSNVLDDESDEEEEEESEEELVYSRGPWEVTICAGQLERVAYILE
jgi:hypothetical protein